MVSVKNINICSKLFNFSFVPLQSVMFITMVLSRSKTSHRIELIYGFQTEYRLFLRLNFLRFVLLFSCFKARKTSNINWKISKRSLKFLVMLLCQHGCWNQYGELVYADSLSQKMRHALPLQSSLHKAHITNKPNDPSV